MRSTILFVACALVFASQSALAAGPFQAQATTRTAAINVPAGGPVNYMIDDGGNEDNVGLTGGGQFLWLNRFDVLPANQPVGIVQVQVFWDPTAPAPPVSGNAVSLEIYSDTDADPANGATHLYTENTVVAQVGTSFDLFNMTVPPQIAAPAVNLLVGVVNRWDPATGDSFPAAIDQTALAVRSWVGLYTGNNPPTPPPVPAPTFGTIDSFGFPGNWLVRAVGDANVPVELQSFSID